MTLKLPKSAKQLNRLLLDYSIDLIKNGSLSDVNGMAETATRLASSDPDAPQLAKMLAGIGEGKGILACYHYWTFRDAVQEFQLTHNISAVEWETAEWKGEQLRYPMIADQLQCLERDIEICSRYKDKTVAKFLDFCDRWHLPIFLEDKEKGPVLCTAEDVLKEAAKHQWAWLGHNSDVHPVYCSETDKILYYQAEYSIRLSSGDTENPMREGCWFQGRQELRVAER